MNVIDAPRLAIRFEIRRSDPDLLEFDGSAAAAASSPAPMCTGTRPSGSKSSKARCGW